MRLIADVTGTLYEARKACSLVAKSFYFEVMNNWILSRAFSVCAVRHFLVCLSDSLGLDCLLFQPLPQGPASHKCTPHYHPAGPTTCPFPPLRLPLWELVWEPAWEPLALTKTHSLRTLSCLEST